MNTKTKLERLAEHYDSTDTAAELEEATAADGPDTAAPGEPMTTFAVRLPVVLLDHVREIAQDRDLTTSALIRQWIESGAAEESGGAEGRVVPVRALLELIGRAPRDS